MEQEVNRRWNMRWTGGGTGGEQVQKSYLLQLPPLPPSMTRMLTMMASTMRPAREVRRPREMSLLGGVGVGEGEGEEVGVGVKEILRGCAEAGKTAGVEKIMIKRTVESVGEEPEKRQEKG